MITRDSDGEKGWAWTWFDSGLGPDARLGNRIFNFSQKALAEGTDTLGQPACLENQVAHEAGHDTIERVPYRLGQITMPTYGIWDFTPASMGQSVGDYLSAQAGGGELGQRWVEDEIAETLKGCPLCK